jgi:hypothetical protein
VSTPRSELSWQLTASVQGFFRVANGSSLLATNPKRWLSSIGIYRSYPSWLYHPGRTL